MNVERSKTFIFNFFFILKYLEKKIKKIFLEVTIYIIIIIKYEFNGSSDKNVSDVV